MKDELVFFSASFSSNARTRAYEHSTHLEQVRRDFVGNFPEGHGKPRGPGFPPISFERFEGQRQARPIERDLTHRFGPLHLVKSSGLWLIVVDDGGGRKREEGEGKESR